MCLPYTLLRWTVAAATLLVMVPFTQAAGAIIIWGGVEVKNMAFMQSFEKYHSDYVGYAIIAFGGAVILVGILGLAGAICKMRLCLGFVTLIQFFAFMLKVGIILVAAGAAALYFKGYLEDKLTVQECLNITLLKKGDEAVIEASAYMCNFICPCDYSAQFLAEYTLQGRILVKGSALNIEQCHPCEGYATYTVAQQAAVTVVLTAAGMTLAQCQSYDSNTFLDQYFTSDQRMLFPLLTWVEETFHCAGLCTATSMYMFSDINNAVPTIPNEACVQPLHDWVGEKFPIFGGIGVGFGGFMLIIAIATCCLCCHPKRPGK